MSLRCVSGLAVAEHTWGVGRARFQNAALALIALAWPILNGCTVPSGEAESGGRVSAASPPRLILDKTGAIRIPSGFRVAGGRLMPDGSVVLWATNSSSVLRVNGARLVDTTVLPAATRAVSVTLSESGDLEYVDSHRREIATQNIAGRGARKSRCSVPLFDIWTATKEPGGPWYIAGFDSIGKPLIAINTPNDCNSWRFRASDGGAIATISSSLRGTAVAYRDPHRGIEWIDHRGVTRRTLRPDSAELKMLNLAADSSAQWIATEATALDSGTLQVIVDLKSERRKLVLRDQRGGVLRVSEIHGMWTVLDGDAQSHRLAAFHRGDTDELLLYKWRWQP